MIVNLVVDGNTENRYTFVEQPHHLPAVGARVQLHDDDVLPGQHRRPGQVTDRRHRDAGQHRRQVRPPRSLDGACCV